MDSRNYIENCRPVGHYCSELTMPPSIGRIEIVQEVFPKDCLKMPVMLVMATV
jgi:hypothetical protein